MKLKQIVISKHVVDILKWQKMELSFEEWTEVN